MTSDEEPHLEVARVSFDLVRRVYNSFGFTDDDVPYTNGERDAIDIA